VSAEETESPPALRAANAELRAENRKLKDRLRRVKEHVRKLRSGGANRSASNSRPPAEEDADASDPEGEE
jgi:cell division protein FtsB